LTDAAEGAGQGAIAGGEPGEPAAGAIGLQIQPVAGFPQISAHHHFPYGKDRALQSWRAALSTGCRLDFSQKKGINGGCNAGDIGMARRPQMAPDGAAAPVAGNGAGPPSLGEGLHFGIPPEIYHADPCAKASLSAHLAHTLLTRSPAHAWLASPKLNPDYRPDHDPGFDLGTAAHAFLIDREGARFAAIDAADWRTKRAKDFRAAALRDGRIPVLARQWAQVNAMVDAARAQLAQSGEGKRAFQHGHGEVTAIWREGPIWCRGRIDWLDERRRDIWIWDYKTTSASARADQWGERQFFDGAAYLQAVFYARALWLIRGERYAIRVRFVVQEIEPPYALQIMAPSPTSEQIASDAMMQAIEAWTVCMRRRQWPAYSRRTAWIEPPPWRARSWEEAHQQQIADRDAGVDPYQFAIRMWRP